MMFRWPVSALLLCGAALAAQETPTFRSDVNLVRVVATVRNQKGELVGTLQKDDFEIYDNGVNQEIRSFEHQTEQPLSVALLIDTSGSTAKELKYETDSAARFSARCWPRAIPRTASRSTPSTTTSSRAASPATTRPSSASSRCSRARPAPPCTTPSFSRRRPWKAAQGRKVIVVITDGGDTISTRDLKTALEAAQLADAVIYAIVVMPITNDAGRNIGGENALQFMAEGTGGRTFYPAVGAQLDKAFTRHHPRTAHPVPAGLLSAPAPPFPRTASTTGSPREIRRFAGLGAQRLLWGIGGRAQRAVPHFGQSGTAEEAGAAKKEAGEVTTPPPGKSARAPEQTFEEAKYLKQLIENSTPVRVKMEDGEEVAGIIEYYDQSFIRLTREGEPTFSSSNTTSSTSGRS